ncbi:MAG: helix-turn-helix transcriptional regulator [Acidobacteriota bacterium]
MVTESILRLPKVIETTGLSRSSVYQYVADGRFPKPVQLGTPHRIGWAASEVQGWIQDQIRASRSE